MRRDRRRDVRRASESAVQSLESRTLFSVSLVKDINTVLDNADPAQFVPAGGKLYFAAGSDNGYQYFETDGTAGGTVPMPNLVPGSVITDLTVANGTLYFFAQVYGTGTDSFYRSDGTVAGTTRITTVADPKDLTNVNGTLYFSAYDVTSQNTSLWKSDGTASGTVELQQFGSNYGDAPSLITEVGGKVFFSADESSLWETDGTAAGTIDLSDNLRQVTSIVDVNGRAYVSGFDSLWTSDGTPTGTYEVRSFSYGSMGQIANFDGTVYFGATDATLGSGLWTTDGTAAGTTLVKSFAANEFDSLPEQFGVLDGTLYFAAEDSTHGLELWRSDGTAAGTTLVDDINPGPADGIWNQGTSVVFNGNIYFDATDGSGKGIQLWRSDGTAAGTSQVYQFTSDDQGSQTTDTSTLTIGGITYFVANDGVHGNELWKTDGTTAGTSLVADLNPGAGNSNPTDLFNFNGTLFFAASDGTQTDLWKTDGTVAGTVIVKQNVSTGYFPYYNESNYDLTSIGDTLYFFAYNGVNGVDLYKSDGSAAGTTSLMTDFTYVQNQYPYRPTMSVLSGSLIFTADPTQGPSLWKTDGTVGGTAEIAAMSITGPLVQFGSNLYFDLIGQLWKTDGTAAGTTEALSFGSGANYGILSLSALNGGLYISTIAYPYYSETGTINVYKSDGTATGTTLVFSTTSNGEAGAQFTAAAGKVFFLAPPVINGPGGYGADTLYVTDGTPAGTYAFDPHLSVEAGQPMIAANDLLYFIGSDNGPFNVMESDGTSFAVADPSQNTTNWSVYSLIGKTSAGMTFWASDAAHGIEPWVLPLPATTQLGDSGFENPPVGNGTYGSFAYNPTNTPWSFYGDAGVSGNGSGFTAGNPNAPQGTQVGFLQMAGSSIGQQMTLNAGTYTVSFDAAQRVQWQNGLQDFEVLVDGNVVGKFTPAAGGTYQQFASNAFNVSAGTHTIEFLGLDSAGGDKTAFIDNVQVAPTVASQPFFADYGFESPSVGSGSFNSFAYDPTGSAWTFTGNAGISGNQSGFTSSNPNAPEGTQVDFLQFAGSSISQTINLAAESYIVKFDAAQRVAWQTSRQDFAVEVDGQTIETFTPAAGGGYQSYQTTPFLVTAGPHTITFVGLDTAGGDNTAFIDAVQILRAQPVQPVDGSFETPSLGSGPQAYQYDPTGSLWTFSGTAGISGNGSDFTGGNQPAPQGGQVAFLQFAGASFSQTVSSAGGTFAIQFAQSQRVLYQNGGRQDFQVLVDGVVVGTFDPQQSNGQYVYTSTSAFTLTAGNHTITFKSLDTAGGDNTIFIDDVKLEIAD